MICKVSLIEKLLIPALAVIACAIIALVLWVVPSYFEARSYNKLTGSNVSTWDAMWVELRVDGGSQS